MYHTRWQQDVSSSALVLQLTLHTVSVTWANIIWTPSVMLQLFWTFQLSEYPPVPTCSDKWPPTVLCGHIHFFLPEVSTDPFLGILVIWLDTWHSIGKDSQLHSTLSFLGPDSPSRSGFSLEIYFQMVRSTIDVYETLSLKVTGTCSWIKLVCHKLASIKNYLQQPVATEGIRF